MGAYGNTTINTGLPDVAIGAYSGDTPLIYTPRFERGIIHVYQAARDVLNGRVMEKTGRGSEKVRFEYMGKSTAKTRTARPMVLVPYGSSATGDATTSQHNLDLRWCFPQIYYEDRSPSRLDDVYGMTDIKSPTMKSIVMALIRKQNQIVFNAAIGTVYTGPEGNFTSVPLPAAQIVNADGVGMTTGKVRLAKYKMDYAEAPMEDRYLFYAPEQLDNMLAFTEIGSSDYNNVKALVDGVFDKWLGFQWVPVSPDVLPKTGTGGDTIRHAVAWQKEAVGRCFWDTGTTIAQQIPHWAMDWLLYREEQVGGTRMHEGGVVRIDCAEVLQS